MSRRHTSRPPAADAGVGVSGGALAESCRCGREAANAAGALRPSGAAASAGEAASGSAVGGAGHGV